MSASPPVPEAGSSAQPEFRELKQLLVSEIDRGDNPRLHFTEEEMERLAESIDKEGVLVPVVVYPMDGKYILIDGERRWRTAQTLGLERLPAVITDPPSEQENLVRMFNIHQVREPWGDMPTAWAVQKLLSETGDLSNRDVSDLTGLSMERLARLLHALELPAEYQRYIDEGRVPLNFFWELKRSVIDPIANRRPALAEEFEGDEMLRAFVDKRLARTITDTISLRKVGAIVRVAEREAGDDPRAPSPLDDTIRLLIRDPDVTIDDAYQDTVEITVESDKLERRVNNLVAGFERLIAKARTDNERGHIHELGAQLVARIRRLLRTE